MTEQQKEKQDNDHADEREGFFELDEDQMDFDGFDPITPATEQKENIPC